MISCATARPWSCRVMSCVYDAVHTYTCVQPACDCDCCLYSNNSDLESYHDDDMIYCVLYTCQLEEQDTLALHYYQHAAIFEHCSAGPDNPDVLVQFTQIYLVCDGRIIKNSTDQLPSSTTKIGSSKKWISETGKGNIARHLFGVMDSMLQAGKSCHSTGYTWLEK